MQHHSFQPLLVGIDEAASIVSFAPATLTSWAYRRKPAPEGFPEPIRVSGGSGRRATLRYRVADLIAWVDGLAGGGRRFLEEHRPGPAATAKGRRPGPGRPRSKATASASGAQ